MPGLSEAGQREETELKIAITGGIGAGKSYIGKLLKSMGYEVLDTDEIAKRLMAPGSPMEARVLEAFGACIAGADGHLDRTALLSLILDDPEARERLNRLTHPSIMAEAMARCEAGRITFVEVPLLYEAGLEGLFDEVWVLTVPLEVRRSRLLARGMKPEAIQGLVEAQLTEAERLGRGGIPLEGDSPDLKEHVIALVKGLEMRMDGKQT